MATINLMDAGLMIIAQESGKGYSVTEPKYRVSLKCFYAGNDAGKIRVTVGTTVSFLAESLSDVLFEGQPAVNWDDFHEKEKTLFRKANTGSGSSGTTVFEADENVSAGVAVVISDGKAIVFNPNDTTHIGRVAGITKSSGVKGDAVIIQTDGEVYDAGYLLEENKPCFVNQYGQITTVVPQTKIIQPIGFSINQKTFFIHLLTPLYHA